MNWTKETPTEPGDYWMKDEGGGPTLYECQMIDCELRCGPKSKKHRWPVKDIRMSTTEWASAHNAELTGRAGAAGEGPR